MFRFSVCLIYVSNPCMIKFCFVSFHVINFDMFGNDNRIIDAVEILSISKILVDKIKTLVHRVFLKNISWGKQGISGIHLDSRILSLPQYASDRSGQSIIKMRESLILNFSCMSVHQSWCKYKIFSQCFFEFSSIFHSFSQIICVNIFVIIHKQNIFSSCLFCSKISHCTYVIVRKFGI